MIHGFYFRFLRMTHCKWLSVILAKMAYMVFCGAFLLQKLRLKPHIVRGDPEEARKKIATVHPDPHGRPQIENAPADPSVDLSIIVPVYNYADLIRENIASILGQKTGYHYELILVDDGSTDGAREILLSYREDPRVSVILQENQGIAAARNTGVNHARGKYIMFVDCDDVVTDDIVETLMGKAYSDDCDIVMCAHERIKEKSGKITEIVPNIYSDKNLYGYCDGAQILNYAGLPWCKVYRRELWDHVRFMPGYWYEDTIIHALMFTQCRKFAYIPRICYKYRWYEKNFSHTQGKRSNPKSMDKYWLLAAILEKAEELQITGSDCFYTMLLSHLCPYYYNTVKEMDGEMIEALFVLACDIWQRYRPGRSVKLPYMRRMAEHALQTGDMALWALAAKYQ